MRTLTSREALGGTLQRGLETVWAFLNSLESVTVGPAIAVYHLPCQDDMLDVSAGFPVQEPIEPSERLCRVDLPSGAAATLLHVGPYEGLQGAHAQLDEWMARNGHAPGRLRYEIYWVDPGQAKSPDELRTEIVCPLM